MLVAVQPERIDPPDPNRPDYDVRADVWSMGLSLVELATGRFPYAAASDFELLTLILKKEPPSLPRQGNFSAEFHHFISLWCGPATNTQLLSLSLSRLYANVSY